MKRFLSAVTLAGAVAGAAACAGGGAGDQVQPEAALVTEVRSPWSRPADSGAVGVAYFVLVNGDSTVRTLTSVSSPVSRAAEVHETFQQNGMAHMHARASVEVPARDSVVFAAGGLHVMLIDLRRALSPGDTIPLTLHFTAGDSLPVRVGVRDASGQPATSQH